jgi:hypothetical protein
MLLPFVPQFQRRRGSRRKPPANIAPPPPPVADQILSVVHGINPEQIVVTVSSEVVSVQNPGLGLWVSSDGGGTWTGADSADASALTTVVFTFVGSVSDATLWHVEDPSVWEMGDSGMLVAPYDGSIS